MESAVNLGFKGLEGFGYDSVQLKDSHWKQQRDETIELYLNIPDDELLHLFRVKAGLPSSVNGLTGWYGSNANTFGQKLGAFAKLYRVTGDQRLKEKALHLAEEWMKCAETSELLYEHDTYVFDKLLGGFLDLVEFLDCRALLPHLLQLTRAADARFKKDIKRDGLQDHELWHNQMIEWYTLPENLYRAWQLTGEPLYKSFAEQWDYDYFWNKLNSRDFRIGPRHAYSHVNSLSSAARAYEATGDERYLTAMTAAYDEITSHHIFATGGYGPAECLFPDKEGYLGDSLKSTWDPTLGSLTYTNFGGSEVTRNDTWGSCEVSCCAWAVFKYCNYLLKLTGEAKYGDWAEKMLINGTGGQLPVHPDGKVMYYADYFLDGGLKSVEDRRLQENGEAFEWQCCTGTFPQDVAEYANMLYYRDQDGLYISQYLPSTVTWTQGSSLLALENHSDYPDTSRIRLRLAVMENLNHPSDDSSSQTAPSPSASRQESSGPRCSFRLRLRVPSWADGANTISVNGIRQSIACSPGEWAEIDRVWHDGDVVEADFPYRLYFTPVDEQNPGIAALSFGPLVLTADKMTLFEGEIDRPAEWIHPVPGQPLTFMTLPGHVRPYAHLTRTFTPYYKVGEMEWYYMYNRIAPPENR
ncbi:beta-L-arabinofuranosidase domain-containing protein [Paenibacillus pinistramenti]|uniref:beta-L-arabinofuranosidase domain-containing protein n=1 Tax=Paenibacillus pinistramenti TaxID=1768003 RepID=UPI0013968E8C|nr:beta-L-arabinofuranosidase domain-containing protein [Paenibacillus pinistramenti]